MTLQVWIAFVVLETVLCFTPGPAVLFVVSTSLSRGTRAGLGGAWGIVGCNTFYFLLSALGVAAVILASGRLFTALKWIGAAYLVWLGLRMLWSRAAPTRGSGGSAGALAARGARARFRRAGRQSEGASVLRRAASAVHRRARVGAGTGRDSCAHFRRDRVRRARVLRLAFGTRGRLAGDRWTAWLQRVSGGFLVAAGARLALARST